MQKQRHGIDREEMVLVAQQALRVDMDTTSVFPQCCACHCEEVSPEAFQATLDCSFWWWIMCVPATLTWERNMCPMADKFRQAMDKIQLGWTEAQVKVLFAPPDEIKPLRAETARSRWGPCPFSGTVTFQNGEIIGIEVPIV